MQDSADWQAAWQPMVDAVGRDFGARLPEVWGEPIEAGAVARYLEPLELASPIHHDAAVARSLGYRDIVVPYTALMTFSLPLMWRPGDAPLFDKDGRDAMPARNPLGGARCGLEPPITNSFATGWDTDFLQPAVVGDRIRRRGLLLQGCRPKQTRVGRGAFINWQSEIINDRHELLARLRTTLFLYNPLTKTEPAT